MKRGQRRPAGIRISSPRSARIHRHEKTPLGAAQRPQDALPPPLLRLWVRHGGSHREYIDGSVELLGPNRESVLRAPSAAVSTWLRQWEAA